MTFFRSTAFSIAFFLWHLVLCVFFLWLFLLPRRFLMPVVRFYLRGIAWMERHILGLDWQLIGRENLPEGPCIVAPKHQSAWETMKLHFVLRDPAIVLKRELMYVPIWGWYVFRAGAVPVDRGAGGKALRGMIRAAKEMAKAGREIVIFPQGTRVLPGQHETYKIGVAALYEGLKLPVVPIALNSGLFWPKRGTKRGGTVTMEILPPIPPGLGRETMMKRLEDELEAASVRLAADA